MSEKKSSGLNWNVLIVVALIGLTIVFSGSNQLQQQGVTNFSSLEVSGATTLAGTNTLSGATTISGAQTSSGVSTFSGGSIFSKVAGADSATTNEYNEIVFTSPVDTTGSNTHNALTCDLAIGNATGGTNVVSCLQIDGISADAQVTETGINIGVGWDSGITNASPTTLSGINTLSGVNGLSGLSTFSGGTLFTNVATADSAATNDYNEIVFTTPVDTTGVNTHNAFTIDLGIGASTGGMNNVRGVQIDGITCDPEVTCTAMNVDDGWDLSFDTSIPHLFTAVQVFEEFLGDTVNPAWDYDSGSAASDPALNAAQYGTLRGTTNSSNSGFANDHVGMDFGGVFWSADQGELIFEARINIDDITNSQICVGLTDTETMEMVASIGGSDTITTNADDAAVFCYDTGADTDEWFFITVAGTTDGTGIGATGVAPANGIYQTLRIHIHDGDIATFYIDGVFVGATTANAITITDLLTPVVVLDNLDAAARVFDLDYIFVGAGRD